jgi:hypothetical protein
MSQVKVVGDSKGAVGRERDDLTEKSIFRKLKKN